MTAVRRYASEIGKLDWAAPQDWMCEPFMVAKTGLSVEEHQARTVANVVELRQIAPDLPFIPVLQGWTLPDYLRCVQLYERVGIDLTHERIVGLGSVCRRQSTDEIGEIVRTLHSMGIRLHGFGVKTEGLKLYGEHLESADSMAWSLNGRYVGSCVHARAGHTAPRSESNCRDYAMRWRNRILEACN